MAGVSPWFFTVSLILLRSLVQANGFSKHYAKNTYNKNFIYRPDHWLFATRWEFLIKQRDSIDLAQIITWNDYGESHYVGPIEGAQPNSQAWTNGFDHQGQFGFHACASEHHLIFSLAGLQDGLTSCITISLVSRQVNTPSSRETGSFYGVASLPHKPIRQIPLANQPTMISSVLLTIAPNSHRLNSLFNRHKTPFGESSCSRRQRTSNSHVDPLSSPWNCRVDVRS